MEGKAKPKPHPEMATMQVKCLMMPLTLRGTLIPSDSDAMRVLQGGSMFFKAVNPELYMRASPGEHKFKALLLPLNLPQTKL